MGSVGLGSGGFTLIELMISVAISGLLASIAIPEFRTMRLLEGTGGEDYLSIEVRVDGELALIIGEELSLHWAAPWNPLSGDPPAALEPAT